MLSFWCFFVANRLLWHIFCHESPSSFIAMSIFTKLSRRLLALSRVLRDGVFAAQQITQQPAQSPRRVNGN